MSEAAAGGRCCQREKTWGRGGESKGREKRREVKGIPKSRIGIIGEVNTHGTAMVEGKTNVTSWRQPRESMEKF